MAPELLIAMAVIVAITVGVPLLLHFSRHIGPRFDSPSKSSVYESGIATPVGDTSGRFGIRFYLVAVLFALFDVEIIFIYAWAVNVRDLGIFGLVEMFLFMGLLIAGLLYIYWKKALKWD